MNAFRIKNVAAVLLLALSVTAAHAVTIDWVTVGDPGNANDTINTGTNPNYGAVADSYQIGKYDVTISQYTDFLNAAAKSDPYSLYNSNMASDLTIAGISRAGS
ncbi:MAG: PEP-CTERM sorting domain-containing protein, partial [Planctomycetia bacterium]